MPKTERVFLAILALLGIGFYVQINDLPQAPFQPVGPAGFSKIILGLLAIGLLWVIADFLKKGKTGSGKKGGGLSPAIIKLQAVTFVLFFAYCALFRALGYFTTGFLVLVVYMHFLYHAQNGKIRLKESLKLVGMGLLSVGVMYVIFAKMFALWLPRGIFI